VAQSTAAWLLFKIGNIETPISMPPLFDVVRRYLDKPGKLKLLMTVGDEPFRVTGRALDRAEKRGEKTIDPTPLIKQIERKHGVCAAQMAVEMVLSLNRSLHIMPWSRIRMVDWKDTVRLHDLFKNELLTTHYGFFLDQRFIDFLSSNFDRIDEINWRKFEGLAGEFFAREGYHVEMGRGRGDQGVDLRV
jgi:restriction system protein